MSSVNEKRIIDGQAVLKEQLESIEATAEEFLSALKGFRRDLPLSVQSCGDYFDADFSESADGMAVPKLLTGMSFADLSGMLSLAESAIDGSIKIKNPPLGPDQEAREKILHEIGITHTNLMDVSDRAYELYQCLQSACFEFDVFNTKNIEVGFTEANILFERDSLNAARALARALSERAIRLDIDLMESKKRLETGQKKVTI